MKMQSILQDTPMIELCLHTKIDTLACPLRDMISRHPVYSHATWTAFR
jgi:hypothetical protein